MEISEEQYLKHFGVLGMKWGIRKYSSAAGFEKGRAEALRKTGYLKEAKAAERSAEVHGAKAANIQKKLDNYRKFQSDLKAAKKAGKGNDMDAVLAACKSHDKAEADRKAAWKKAPKFTFKEKLYRGMLGDPAIPMGERIAVTALVSAGAISYAYIVTHG